jgi:hypothetical protein
LIPNFTVKNESIKVKFTLLPSELMFYSLELKIHFQLIKRRHNKLPICTANTAENFPGVFKTSQNSSLFLFSCLLPFHFTCHVLLAAFMFACQLQFFHFPLFLLFFRSTSNKSPIRKSKSQNNAAGVKRS